MLRETTNPGGGRGVSGSSVNHRKANVGKPQRGPGTFTPHSQEKCLKRYHCKKKMHSYMLSWVPPGSSPPPLLLMVLTPGTSTTRGQWGSLVPSEEVVRSSV